MYKISLDFLLQINVFPPGWADHTSIVVGNSTHNQTVVYEEMDFEYSSAQKDVQTMLRTAS